MSVQEQVAGGVLLALWRARKALTAEALAHAAGAEMALVLNGIEALRRRGCLMERSPAGVELISVGLACWREVLEDEARRAGGGRKRRRVEVLARTASTNDIAWQAAAEAQGEELVVIADEQTAGRGRRGHGWHAKAGQSVLMSILLPGMEAKALDRLTLLAGLAAAEGIEQAVGKSDFRVELRWPNDLQVRARKLGGILVEGRGVGNGRAAVVGIGINVAQGPGDFSEEVAGRGISVFQAAGVLVDRVRVVAGVLAALDRRIAATQDNSWIDEWKGRCGLLGQRITARVGQRAVTGTVVDIDPLHGLVVRDDGGGTQFLSAGTATLSVG